jgi:ATPase subunit of ABC transporter with duplicated ATPase domains
MLVSIDNIDKRFGDKVLYSDLSFRIEKAEKVGVIGRNGVGKSTIFNLLSGYDTEFDGSIQFARNTITVATRQEHHGVEHLNAVDYILSELPNFTKLKKVIDDFAVSTDPSNAKMNAYSDALEQFSSLGYYEVEESIVRELATYQIDEDKARGELGRLSGGQKRFVELVKIAHSQADLALIDEPTNHMDYIAKDAFIAWLKTIGTMSALIITHDRDVLAEVDRIIEIKDGQAYEFKGNYQAYLKQNSSSTVNQMKSYEVAQASIVNLKKQISYAKRMKPSWSGTADQKNPFIVMENRLTKQMNELVANNPKPSLWIDRESLEQISDKVTGDYHKYKAKNIRIGTKADGPANSGMPVVAFDKLSLGYTYPLFSDVTAQLRDGEHMRLHGRNGAGKTTLVRSIIAAENGNQAFTPIHSGTISIRPKTTIGVYEQEVGETYFEMPLADAIEKLYMDRDVKINQQKIMQLMGDYLFNPTTDGRVPISQLSGGQKARFQLISMLAGDPQLLILDEPTNHLDLPSIEELEDALQRYSGAIIFVSHDSYFVNKFDCQTIPIGV